jgi:hypothetical protein
MNTKPGLDRCLTFINCQLQPAHPGGDNGARRAAVTLSRQAGSGSHVVAERLLEYLQTAAPQDACPWTIFDRNLVEKVLEDHHLPTRLARFMTEDRISEIADTMDELFGLHPPSWTLVRQTSDTILRLAELGNVILIGRGAHVITAKLDHVFHVRLVGSLERRLEHIQEYYKLGKKAALGFLREEDGGRRRYLKKYFGKDIDDPLLYDMILNTDRMSYAEAAVIIGNAVLRHKLRAAVPG